MTEGNTKHTRTHERTECAGPYIGRNHDSLIAGESDLNKRLSEFCRTEYGDYAIYGDPAYAHDEFVFKPHDRAVLTHHEHIAKTPMCSARVAVERAIGRVVNVFPALDFLRTARSVQTHEGLKYMVAVFLTNCLTYIRGSNQICVFLKKLKIAPRPLKQKPLVRSKY